MKTPLFTAQRLFWVLAPLAASSAIASLPSQAATLAFSQSTVDFSNFSQSPNVTDTFTDTDTLVISTGGNALASAIAEAQFTVFPPVASNITNSTTTGEGIGYSGQAISEARIIGQFLVETQFSFDFQATLNLATAIDDASFETAEAFGALGFSLLDSSNPNAPVLIDQFSLLGSLPKLDNSDVFRLQPGNHIVLGGSTTLQTTSGEKSESAEALITGFYQRSFASPTSITLVENKFNQANVQSVPDPSTVLGTLSFTIAVLVRKMGRKIMKS
jgi:hypothetical protein